MNAIPLVRVNVTLPKDIVDAAKQKGGVSKYATESMRERLAREKREEAFESIVSGPPTFTHIKDASKYVHDMRQENEKRMKRLGL